MARKQKTRRPIAEINVVPYIDVMLVLLVIFMITAPLLTQGVKVDLHVAISSNGSWQPKLALTAGFEAALAQSKFYRDESKAVTRA